MARIRIQEPIHLVLSQMPNHLNPNAAETAALLGRGRSDRGLAGRRSKHEWTTTRKRYAFHTSSTCDANPPYHRTTLQILWAKVSQLVVAVNAAGTTVRAICTTKMSVRMPTAALSRHPFYVRICCSNHTICTAHVATVAAYNLQAGYCRHGAQ